MRVKHRVARVPRRQSRLVHVLQCMKYKVHSDEEFRFIHEPRSNDAGESRTCTTSTRTGIYLNSSEPANSTACSISSHSTASTPTPTSSQGSSRECRRVVQLVIFGDTLISLKHSKGYVEGNVRKKSQLNLCSRFDMYTILEYDRQTDSHTFTQTHTHTDTQRQHIPRGSQSINQSKYF